MKQLLFITLLLCVLLLMGCQSDIPQDNNTTQTTVPDATWQEVNNPPLTETTGATAPTEGRSDATDPTQANNQQTSTAPTESTVKNDNTQPTASATEPTETTEPPKETTKPPKEDITQQTDPPETTAPPTQATEPEETEPSKPQVPKATAADADKIAQRLVECLNEYRASQGTPKATVLPGLSRYAKYRSRQLTSNFAHDTADERAAATALEYGSYVDPSLFGMTGDPYYTANAREAIAKTDYGGTVDEVAAYLARLTRNSSSHWSYVGGAGYTYIGVGITYENGIWYCDIAVTSQNTDN